MPFEKSEGRATTLCFASLTGSRGYDIGRVMTLEAEEFNDFRLMQNAAKTDGVDARRAAGKHRGLQFWEYCYITFRYVPYI